MSPTRRTFLGASAAGIALACLPALAGPYDVRALSGPRRSGASSATARSSSICAPAPTW